MALPVLQSELKATSTDVQWIVESYALFLAALILVGGSLGDRYAVARTAGLLGIAVLNIFVFNVFNRSLNQRMTALLIPLEVQKLLDNQRIKLAGAEVPSNVSVLMSTKLKSAIAFAFVDSFRLVMFLGVGLALASAIVAFLMIKKQPKTV